MYQILQIIDKYTKMIQMKGIRGDELIELMTRTEL
jgi:hypothetical protein